MMNQTPLSAFTEKLTRAVTMENSSIQHLPPEFFHLAQKASLEGFEFVQRTIQDWESGKNRFNKSGEIFYIALIDQNLIGCCGLNIDPYLADPSVARLRHLY